MWLPEWFKKRRPARAIREQHLRILAVSIGLDDRFLLERVGKRHDWEFRFTHSPRDAFLLASHSHFELILCDRNQQGYPWREVMGRLAESSPRSCILLVSPLTDDYLWQDVLEQGGYDVLQSPLEEGEVVQLVDTAVFSLNTPGRER